MTTPTRPPRCATCRKRPADTYDDRTLRPLCAQCWLKRRNKPPIPER